ncbi:AP2/ERF and B3 domain-containing transcription factor [Zea mays]|uniref:AP2/ERF and B3 domain-containing transcription factor n=2 Tax=Zea mays TaxID=4577 RepID=A0A1D6IYX3_MAIZE|nr:AP2/ERF and B3 domain-containing transcription factor [Zea mays]
MEVQMGKAPPCLNPFLMVNPLLPPQHVSPWSSKSVPVFQFGMTNGHGALDLCEESKRARKVVHLEYLFSKVLTPSDVGKLNRLLIPRQCAEGFFPMISEVKSGGDDIFLNFEDTSTGLVWRFRFCLWNNSKTYVLTKGWSVFIKEKNLKKGDILSFYRDASKSIRTNHLFIHIKPHTGTMPLPHHVPSPVFSPSGMVIDDQVHDSLNIGKSHGIAPSWKPLSFGSGELMPSTNPTPQQTTFPESTSLANSIVMAEKHLRLFGVDIDIPTHRYGDESSDGFIKNIA